MNYIALYKGPADNLTHKIGHWAICLWTRSKYSHCEVVIDGVCYSSSGRDGGVRKKSINLDSGKWDLMPVPDLDTRHVLDLFNRTQNDDYDYRGLAWFVAPFVKDHKTRWFCSEWTAVALKLENSQQYHIQGIVDKLKEIDGSE